MHTAYFLNQSGCGDMTPTKFILNGREYMKVTPAEWMMNSKLIADQIRNGNEFAVNLNTGELVVYSKQTLDILIRSKEVHTQAADSPSCDVQFYREKLRAIVREARGALGE